MSCINRTKNRSKQEGGFSLLETAVAMVVMMIGGLGIAAVFSYAVKNNNGSRDRAIAIAVAQQEIERLRALPFNDVALTATPALQAPTTVHNAGGRFSVSTTIVDTTASLKTIQVRVTPVRSDAWATGSVQLTTERAAFTIGPFANGP